MTEPFCEEIFIQIFNIQNRKNKSLVNKESIGMKVWGAWSIVCIPSYPWPICLRHRVWEHHLKIAEEIQ